MGQLFSILKLIYELLVLGWKVQVLYSEAKRKDWITEEGGLLNAIEKSTTDAEREKLARALFEHRAN